MAKSLNINVDDIDSMTKAELKKEIKCQIERKMFEKVNDHLHMKKMRFVLSHPCTSMEFITYVPAGRLKF